MAVFLGIDTGGTYTDAAVVDAGQTRVLGKAKALTTRPDLSGGIAAAMDAALAAAGALPADVALVSLSTTLATNALVEAQGEPVALVAIGFDAGDLARAGLAEAMKGDPVIAVAGGHDAGGSEATAFDADALRQALAVLPAGVRGVAVAGRFAVRNPAHEVAARALIRAETGLAVTCSHELSARLNGPRRALTAVLNARLVGLIARLIDACSAHLASRGMAVPLRVVRGDGALIAAAQARERPIETILSGPAASIVGARWLTEERDALVSDIGGTTTDVALLRDGLPAIDPEGARVGGFRTMVEAVAMRTTGLGGDSAVHLREGLDGGLRLGPRRLVPVSLFAAEHGAAVHAALDRWLMAPALEDQAGRFVRALGAAAPGLPPREAAVLARIAAAPGPLGAVLHGRADLAAVEALVSRGLVQVSGVTPSDAAHVLGKLSAWDTGAAEKALRLMARRRDGAGRPLAADARALAAMIEAQLVRQTVDCLLEAALAEDAPAADGWGGLAPDALTGHPLLQRALAGHAGALRLSAGLAVPVVGLGASAPAWYPAVGQATGTPRMVLPAHADVANAVGAVVGQIAMRSRGTVTSPAEGRYTAHLPDGPQGFADRDAAIAALAHALEAEARARAALAGAAEVHVRCDTTVREVEVERRALFLEAEVTATATGRPRIARG